MDRIDFIFAVVLLLFVFSLVTNGFLVSNQNEMYEKMSQPIDFEHRSVNWCGDNANLSQSVGQSMKPYTNKQGYFWREPVNPSDVRVGDVIVYEKSDDEYVRHAVIRAYPEYVVTAGYNNENDDGRINRSSILYRDCLPPAQWKPTE